MAVGERMSNDELALGVDIGGTKVAAGIVDSHGQLLFKTRVPMNVTGTADDGLRSVHTAIRTALNCELASHITSIGIASPGPMEMPGGKILHTPNLPCWRNFPLGDKIREAYPLPVHIENDANAAGLAEALWGSGREFNTVFYATVGTGIGTALVCNRSLFSGRTGAAPEGGHMTIDYHSRHVCGCGKRGCVEVLASGPAIARSARERLVSSAARSIMIEKAQHDPQRVTSHIVEEAWRAGDGIATEVLRELADVMTVWFGNIIDLFEPDAIVVGGGVGQLVSEWFPYIAERLPSWSIIPRCNETALRLARYGSDAGVVGAAALCIVATGGLA
jgi:glucokinase